mmetsp:Transcript_22825/g.20301  ORF Transcript_22825/g.20301 Transcript_22825/m.20301 type:complete len:131 (+) Transcript_22825:295-687(+)
MEFDLKDMRKIMREDGEFTNNIVKKSEWERVTEFVLNSDRTRFDFYLTLMNLGLITKTNGSIKKTRRMKSLISKLKLPPQTPIPKNADDLKNLDYQQMKEMKEIISKNITSVSHRVKHSNFNEKVDKSSK